MNCYDSTAVVYAIGLSNGISQNQPNFNPSQ